MLRIAILVSGTGTNLQAVIDSLASEKSSNIEIAAVISSKRGAYALERAKKYNIPSAVVSLKDYGDRREFDEALLLTIDGFQVDLIVLAGYLVILPDCLIRKYRNRIINIHPSLIPAFCGDGFYGLKVHEAVLDRGVRVTGATVHFVDEGTDTGPILLQKPVAVLDGDTPEILQKRVMEEAEWNLLPEAIGLIAGGKVQVKDNKVYFI